MSRLDAMQRTFLAMEDLANVNTHQIIVIGGHLDLDRLREAIRRTAREIDLCTTGVSENGREAVPGRWSPDEIPLIHEAFSGEISFESEPLRRLLMDFSDSHRLQWRNAPPLQFFYVSDETGRRSALMFNAHHGATDAKSDSVLLQRVITHYDLAATPGTASTLRRYPFLAYEALRDQSAPKASRWARARALARQFKIELFTRRSGIDLPKREGEPDAIDFVHHALDIDTELAIRSIARSTKQTINTVITAALYAVVRQSQKPEQSAPIRINCPVSIRGMIDPGQRENFQNLMVPCTLLLDANYPSTSALLASIARRVGKLRQQTVWTNGDQLGLLARALTRKPLSVLRPGVVIGNPSDNVAYSNTGIITEKLDRFGSDGPEILEYASFGCLGGAGPLAFILYSPQFRDRLYLNAIYRKLCFRDVKAQLIDPLQAAILRMAKELESAAG